MLLNCRSHCADINGGLNKLLDRSFVTLFATNSSSSTSLVMERIAIMRSSDGIPPSFCILDSSSFINRIAVVLCSSASVVLVKEVDERRESKWAAAECVLAWNRIGDERYICHQSNTSQLSTSIMAKEGHVPVAIGLDFSDEVPGQKSGQMTLRL